MGDQRLRKFFQFSDNDLFANREGRLSENQKKRLAAQARAEQKSARESAVILFVIAAGGLAFGSIYAFTAPSIGSRLFFVLVLCLLWPLAWGWRAVKIIRAARALSEDQLQSTRGRVRIIPHADPGGGREYTLQVGEMEFDVDGDPSGVLADGEECIVHYLKQTEEILSVEVISNP